jgi:hypothetical protein
MDRLRDNLKRLSEQDKRLALFGASRHRYHLGPCLTLDEVERFEQAHRVTLPEDYRAFLVEVGNGGAGPYYGLASLEEAILSNEEELLARPFPYRQWWNGMDPPDWWDLPNAQSLVGDLHFADYDANHHVQGTLRLAHEGCGYYRLLVICGAERGHMWSDERAGDGGIMPLPFDSAPHRLEGAFLISISDPKARITFSEWYADWLDRSLQQIQKAQGDRSG